jgi:hypothetical protein
MKKSVLMYCFSTLLFWCTISVNATVVPLLKSNLQDNPPLYEEGVSQKITATKLFGNYVLKHVNTSQDRTWLAETRVGMLFFPDTYLYGTGVLNFNAKKMKVALSSISTIKTLAGEKYGSLSYKIKGSRLTIVNNSAKSSGKFIVVSLKDSWLVIEDIRTKNRWAFYKSKAS